MFLLLFSLACKGPDDAAPQVDDSPVEESVSPDDSPSPALSPYALTVTVTLDGAPVEGAAVMQGGLDRRWPTDANGEAQIEVDPTFHGEIVVMASHPDARIAGDYAPSADLASEGMTIALVRFDPSDNVDYEFQDPGEPNINDNTNQCSHCHKTIVGYWYESPHRQSASNARVQDVYAGVASGWTERGRCESAGGVWRQGLEPGTRSPVERCYLGAGTLPDLNPECGAESSCDDAASRFGACADCHAPAINGQLGGHDLLEATGRAWDSGVHCDVCHKVESVDMDAEAGVAGRLHIVRPSEELQGVLGPYKPLTFGPYDDVLNPRMGSVARDLFHEATLCGGCHQLDQAALIPGQSVDTARWPEGRIPVHSTYEEWVAGPMSPGVVCQSCHMPADGAVGNSADAGNLLPDAPAGIAAGWYRPPGSVRQHAWYGPRQRDSQMLELAASIHLDSETRDDALVVHATVKNVGPGHAIPTGEPLRSLVLVVEARCDGVPIPAIGGEVVPDYGGFLDRKVGGEDWSVWPDAAAGDTLRVVTLGDYLDYAGFGPFGDGQFSVEQKGLRDERFVGEVTVLSVASDGTVVTDQPIPAGDVAYRVRPAWPEDGLAAVTLAGAPGWGFARVLVDADGARMVPHHRAVDVVSDNRLLPQQEWTSEHLFSPGCASPELRAVLVHRATPMDIAAERGWTLVDSVMVEVSL